MTNERSATLDAPEKNPLKKSRAVEPASGFSAYVADLPAPFRPRHLTEAIRLYAADNAFSAEELAKVDPARFLREHGLPNPLKRFRVMGKHGAQQSDPCEYDAVDESEACRRYRAERLTGKDADKWNLQCFLVDY